MATQVRCETSAEDFANSWALFANADADSLSLSLRSYACTNSCGASTPRPAARRPKITSPKSGRVYFFKVAVFRANSKSRLAGEMVAHEMPEETLVEIDSLTDWKIVELLATNKFKKRRRFTGSLT